jgi:hypothetical protein
MQGGIQNNLLTTCKIHPDEVVSYFCFTCQCPPVCAECVIHGEHHGH